MGKHNINLNSEVTEFLDGLKHPFRKEIELLRNIILSADAALQENIKWNGPNYSIGDDDRITMRIQPPAKQAQLIFHRGSKKLAQPKEKLISNKSTLLLWKENDRTVAAFKSLQEIENSKVEVKKIISQWLKAAQ